MSMRYYAVDDYGLLLNTNHINLLAAAVLDDFSQEKWDNDCDYRIDCSDEVIASFEAVYYPEFTGECFAIDDDGNDIYSNNFNTRYFDGDTMWFLPCKKIPRLFNAAYNNMDELINEFKETYGKYFPKGFDYKAIIKHIVGTYYG